MSRSAMVCSAQASESKISCTSSTVVCGLTMQMRSTVSPAHAVGHDEGRAGGQHAVAPRLIVGVGPADAAEQQHAQLGLHDQLEVFAGPRTISAA